MDNLKFRNKNITYEFLSSNGYKRYDDKSTSNKTAVWCKKIKDQSGIKYVIIMSEFSWADLTRNLLNDISFEPLVQFVTDDDKTVNVTFLDLDETIQVIEDFYESMWRKMEFAYSEPYY